MQKFKRGDLVRVAKNLGRAMSHFQADCDAIVIGSYDDQYGGGDKNSYTIYIKDGGEVSWYYEKQLTLIEAGREDLLETWSNESNAEAKKKADIDWIFENGDEVLENPHGASLQTLFNCFADGSLWGRSGEGITYFQNAFGTKELAEPFLKAKDKDGWLNFCDELRKDLNGASSSGQNPTAAPTP